MTSQGMLALVMGLSLVPMFAVLFREEFRKLRANSWISGRQFGQNLDDELLSSKNFGSGEE